MQRPRDRQDLGKGAGGPGAEEARLAAAEAEITQGLRGKSGFGVPST